MTYVCQHYESLLAEAKSGKESSISRAVEKAVFSKMNDLQAKVEMYTEEMKSIAEVTTNQEHFSAEASWIFSIPYITFK